MKTVPGQVFKARWSQYLLSHHSTVDKGLDGADGTHERLTGSKVRQPIINCQAATVHWLLGNRIFPVRRMEAGDLHELELGGDGCGGVCLCLCICVCVFARIDE